MYGIVEPTHLTPCHRSSTPFSSSTTGI